jgi:hypothetical protein
MEINRESILPDARVPQMLSERLEAGMNCDVRDLIIH